MTDLAGEAPAASARRLTPTTFVYFVSSHTGIRPGV